MVDVLPEPFATLRYEHGEEKRKLEELKVEVKALKNIKGKGFQERYQRVRDLFLLVESKLLLHMRKEEEGLFPIMMGDEDEIWNLSHLIMEHQGLWKMTREIHGIVDALNRTDEKDEAEDRLIKRLSVKVQLFGGFLSHHMEIEEKVLFPMVLTTMSEAEILHAHGLMKVVETWPSDF